MAPKYQICWPKHFLLDDTIKNNICLFSNENNNIDEDKLKAMKLSFVEHFLNDLPDGINTIVGERGLKLSGGKDKKLRSHEHFIEKSFLVFDEATASLDGIAEKFIIDQLKIIKIKTVSRSQSKIMQRSRYNLSLDQGKLKNLVNMKI